MKVLLPERILETLQTELRKARRREIGGLLVGEHVEGETFRVAEVSVQRSGGTPAHFVRDPAHHRVFLDQYFERTGRDYSRYNYLGEWHSHPSAPATPSMTDCNSMARIVADPQSNANFAVLLIAKNHLWWGLQLSVIGFRDGQPPDPVDVTVEGNKRFKAVRYVPSRRVRWI